MLQAIEARKKMIKEIGYGNGDEKGLEEKLEVARARLADLQAKKAKIDDLERQLKVTQQRNADLKMKNWQKELNGESEAAPLQLKPVPKRRSSRR